MTNSILSKKSKAFALRVIKLYKYLKRRGEDVMSKQVLRSGTSIGANVSEGLFAQSRDDFASKNSIALKEARETFYWLDLLNEAGYLPKTDSTESLISECDELIAMLVSTVKTVHPRVHHP